MENYDQCLMFAKKIRLEFPTLEISFPKKSNFFNFPPRNLFIFSREISGDFGTSKLIYVHFVTDGDLTGDDLLLPASSSPRTLEFRQLYIMPEELQVVIQKLEEICPEKSFERHYLGHCVYSERAALKEAFGSDLIELIFRVALHTVSIIKKGRSILEVTDRDAEAFGSDLLLMIKSVCVDKLIESAFVPIHKLSVRSLLLEQEDRYINAYGKDLVDYVSQCSLKVISESRIFMGDISNIVPGFWKRRIALEEIISPPEWSSISSELWRL